MNTRSIAARGGAAYVDTSGLLDIVVALEADPPDQSALRWVAHHVGGRGLRVLLVTAIPAGPGRPAELDRAMASLTAAAGTLEAMCPAAHVAVKVVDGDPVEEILGTEASLLVIGSHRTGEAPAVSPPSFSTRVAARTNRPVVVVPASWRPHPGPVVVGVAADALAEPVVEFGAAMATATESELALVHVVDDHEASGEPSPLLAQATVVARRAGATRVTSSTVGGDPGSALRAAAAGGRLIVVGRPARSTVSRLLLGSVSRALTERPDRPVAIIPPGAEPI